VLSLTPAQNAPLNISNARLTFGGSLGTTRANDRLLPGDMLQIAFDIENLKADDSGLVQFLLGLEVTDSAGKSIYSAPPELQETFLALGGTKLQSNAWTAIPMGTTPGKCQSKVTVIDQATKTKKELVKSFEVTQPEFGIVAVTASSDKPGQLQCPFGGAVGQAIWLNFNVVHFGRDPQTREPDVLVEVSLLEHGKLVNQKPVSNSIKLLPKATSFIGNSIQLPLTREGEFVIQIKSECKVTKKTSTIKIPLTVTPAPK